MKLTALALAGLIASQAPAQGLYVPPAAPATVDLSSYATKTDVTTAVTNATPAPCTAPLADTLTGSAGTQPVCMARPDATRPTLIQSTTALTAADASFSGNWQTPFASGQAPTGRSAVVDAIDSTSAPVICSFYRGQVTATGFAGRCWQLVPTTLPSTLTAVAGTVVSPLANAAAGLTVRVTGRQ